MPIYEYISDKGNIKTLLCKYEDRPNQIQEDNETFILNKCPGILRPTEENKFGINGKYDMGLGATYTNYKERDRICKEKNLAPISQKEINDKAESVKNHRKKLDKQIEAHDKAVEAQTKHKADYLKVFNSEINK